MPHVLPTGKPAWWRRGWLLLIAAVALMLGAGWFLYRATVPPAWLRAFAADIALRAGADPDATAPEDVREATPRGQADHPYICAARLMPLDWDRMVVAPSGSDIRAHPLLGAVQWPGDELHSLPPHMLGDPRYQLVVLLKGERVVDSALFFTFWADLTDIARPEGYAREEAVFTAASRDRVYILSPVSPMPAVCR